LSAELIFYLGAPKTAGSESGRPAEDGYQIMIAFCSRVLRHGNIFLGVTIITTEVKKRMPNAKVLSEKQAIVAGLTKRIEESSAGVIIDYKGITVAEDSKLRRELSSNGVEYSVVKNTLVRFAIDKLGMSGLDPVLNGTTSMATSTADPIAPIRILSEYSRKMGDKFNIKAAFMDGQVLSAGEIEEISKLPSKDALYAKVLGTMLAPITSLAVVLGQIVEKNGGAAEAAE
jgi:large subunit ribosomal protein L10